MSYPGSKAGSGVAERIIGQMPPHSIYAEAFAGSLVVGKLKRPASTNYAIDADGACIAGLRDAGSHWTLIQGDCRRVLPTLALGPGSLVYMDPPYLLSTRGHRQYYRCELTDQDHAQLLTLADALPCMVMISGYWSDLYGRALQNWRCCSYRTRTRGKTVTEFLWCNFPEPERLHDWRWAGKNFRERLTLKRLAARTLARLDRMNARKRGFVLDAIERHFFSEA